MQNWPLNTVIASRCVTSAGGKKKEQGFLPESQSFTSCQYSFIPGLLLARVMPHGHLAHGSGLVLKWPANARTCKPEVPGCKPDPSTTIPGQWISGVGFPKAFPQSKHQEAMAAADPFRSQNVWLCTQLWAQGILPVAARRFLVCSCILNWILGFGMAGFVLLLISLGLGLITLWDGVSTSSKIQQAASAGRIHSELTTRKTWPYFSFCITLAFQNQHHR